MPLSHAPQHAFKIFKPRMIILMTGILLGLIGLLVRLTYLQINQYHHFKTLSMNNRLRVEPIQPARGLIYDRHHRLLADNIENYSLIFKHISSNHRIQTLKTLNTLLHGDSKNIAYWLKLTQNNRAISGVILKSNLTEQERAIIYVNAFQLPGISLQKSFLRHYPYDEITATPLGMIQDLRNQALIYPAQQKNRLPELIQGLSGVERQYNSELSGSNGYREIEVNANGQQLRTLQEHPPIQGQDLMLTLDADLQRATSKAFDHYTGAAVAIEPKTGDILAISSQPTYEPNYWLTHHNDSKIQQWNRDPDHPLFNKATLGLFPPASTVKPLIGLMALHEGVTDMNTHIDDLGYFQLPHTQHRYRDWLPGGHGRVNLHKAIAVSCDTYFYQLSVKLGIHRINQILSAYGLGQPVSIDLAEHPGVLNSPEWKHAHQHMPWYTGDTIISGIGQGNTLVTPLQLAHMAALMSQQGQGVKPHILKAIIDSNHKILTLPQTPWKTFAIQPQHYEAIIKAMQAVIQSDYTYHTGWRFGQIPYTIAGKTGTAELYHRKDDRHNMVPKHLRDHSLFIGFAPVKHPKIAVAVVVEHDEHATEVARRIFESYFKQHPPNEPNDE